jgi:hypothetical protein
MIPIMAVVYRYEIVTVVYETVVVVVIMTMVVLVAVAVSNIASGVMGLVGYVERRHDRKLSQKSAVIDEMMGVLEEENSIHCQKIKYDQETDRPTKANCCIGSEGLFKKPL